MSESLVTVENVSKKFCRDLKRSLWYGMEDLGRELLCLSTKNSPRLRKDEFWAVNNVSFELKRGECLGLIGRNGAGKSTLLRMLNGLIKPDRGRIKMKGRVGALIALGAGFNPVLTGRENIFVNAAVLGLSTAEIKNKLKQIIEFAELGDFIDSPVQSYSSGMVIRLGFAIATAMDPDVLLLDEVIAVGDLGFKARCYSRISEFLKDGAVVFVSHNINQVTRICHKVLLLEEGKTKCLDDKFKATSLYNELMLRGHRPKKMGCGILKIKRISINGIDYQISNLKNNNLLCAEVNFRDRLTLKINVNCNESVEHAVIIINFRTMDQRLVAECNNNLNSFTLNFIKNKNYEIKIDFDKIQLNPGRYILDFLLMSNDMLFHYDVILSAGYLVVSGNHSHTAAYQILANWDYKSIK